MTMESRQSDREAWTEFFLRYGLMPIPLKCGVYYTDIPTGQAINSNAFAVQIDAVGNRLQAHFRPEDDKFLGLQADVER